MDVTRRTRFAGSGCIHRDGSPVTADDVSATLAAALGRGADEPLELVLGRSTITVSAIASDEDVALLLRTATGDDFADFKRAMEAIRHAHRRLQLVASEHRTPNWGYHDSFYNEWKVVEYGLLEYVGTEENNEQGRHLLHAVELAVPADAKLALGTEAEARSSLVALVSAHKVGGASDLRVSYRDDNIMVSEATDYFGRSYFEAAVQALFQHYLPSRYTRPRIRMADVKGAIVDDPLPAIERRWPLRASALSLLLLLGVSWLVDVDTWSLWLAGVWWALSLAVVVFARRGGKKPWASVGGAATAFLSLVVLFGLVFGIVEDTNGKLVSLTPAWSGGEASLGEMMLVSVGLAVSAGTTDVALQGVARFVAMVELLLFFGTVAGVLGAVTRRLLFDRRATISGNLPIQGALGDDDVPPG